MPKTEFLQIRLSPDERALVRRVAAADYLDVSTWARRILLKAAEKAAKESEGQKRGKS